MLVVPTIPMATADAPGTSPEAAWSLFAIVAILLLIFLIVIGCIALLRVRRRREERREREESAAEIDPWAEAGRRAKP